MKPVEHNGTRRAQWNQETRRTSSNYGSLLTFNYLVNFSGDKLKRGNINIMDWRTSQHLDLLHKGIESLTQI